MNNQEEVGLLHSIMQRMSKGQLSQKVIQAFNALMQEIDFEDDDENQVADENDDDCADETEHIAILMKPERGSLFFRADGKKAGNYRRITPGNGQPEIKLSVPGLEEWYMQWEDEILYHLHHWDNGQWKSWWSDGLQFAKEVKKQLPKNVRLYYFTVNDKVWLIPPESTIAGGVFDTGLPMRV